MAKPDVRKRLMNQFLQDVETRYLEEKKEETERLHNKLVEVIGEEEASPQNTLLVLEVLRAEVLNDCLERFFKPPANLSDKKPEEIKEPGEVKPEEEIKEPEEVKPEEEK